MKFLKYTARAEKLKKAVLEEWNSIIYTQIEALVESRLVRYAAVIEAKSNTQSIS
jgi:hypothetical protein